MTFAGIKDAKMRTDLIRFLKDATASGRTAADDQSMPMGGTMGGSPAPHLRRLEPTQHVRTITYSRDTYRVTTGDGETHEFWERNLRFKTDSSSDGPEKNPPAHRCQHDG